MYGPLTRLNSWRFFGLVRGSEQSASSPRHEAQLGVRVARGDELRHLVELREVSRLASPRRLDGFGRQRGKIAVGGRRHRQCLLSASGAMGQNRRAQTFVRVHPRPKSIPRPQTSLRSAGLVKALRASFAALRPFG